jgi:hypothetical protein
MWGENLACRKNGKRGKEKVRKGVIAKNTILNVPGLVQT